MATNWYVHRLTATDGRYGFVCTESPQASGSVFGDEAVANQIVVSVPKQGVSAAAVLHRVLAAFLPADGDERLAIRDYAFMSLVNTPSDLAALRAEERRYGVDFGLRLTTAFLRSLKSGSDTYSEAHVRWLRQFDAQTAAWLARDLPGWRSEWSRRGVANTFFDLEHLHIDEEHYLPIGFRDYYPTQLDADRDNEPRCRYVDGLKCVLGKSDNDFGYQTAFVAHGVSGYAEDFRRLLNLRPGDRLVLVGIPSSKVGKVNVVQHVIRYLAQAYPEHFIDGSALLVRKVDGVAAHEGHDDQRSVGLHMQAWAKDVAVGEEWRHLPIVVMDDVLTTSASFVAADVFLNETLGVPLANLGNFAFGKSQEAYLLAQQAAVAPAVGPAVGVVFDFDQTLYDTTALRRYPKVAKTEYGAYFQAIRNDVHAYPQAGEMLAAVSAVMPYAIVSNNSDFGVSAVVSNHLNDRVFAYQASTQVVKTFNQQPVFAFQPTTTYLKLAATPLLWTASKMKDPATAQYRYKPLPDAVAQAAAALQKVAQATGRVIGVGNTINDMLAYRAAGLEAVFADFGNRVHLPAAVVPADHIVHSMPELQQLLVSAAQGLDAGKQYYLYAIECGGAVAFKSSTQPLSKFREALTNDLQRHPDVDYWQNERKRPLQAALLAQKGEWTVKQVAEFTTSAGTTGISAKRIEHAHLLAYLRDTPSPRLLVKAFSLLPIVDSDARLGQLREEEQLYGGDYQLAVTEAINTKLRESASAYYRTLAAQLARLSPANRQWLQRNL